jgi:hypothetical protein
MEKLLELSLRMYDGSVPFREYFAVEFNSSVEKYRETKLAYRQGGMKRSMPINLGARPLCLAVRERAELWLTTTRPYLSLDGVVKDTQFWLHLHGIEYDGLLFDDDKYVVLAERIDSERVVAVLDDMGEMYDSAAKVMHYGADCPILFRNDYNAAMEIGRNTVNSLGDAKTIILSRLNWWEGEHEYKSVRASLHHQ